MTQEEIEAFKQKVAVTTKATRPFVCKQATVPGEGTQRKIVLAATTVFGRIKYMTLWHQKNIGTYTVMNVQINCNKQSSTASSRMQT